MERSIIIRPAFDRVSEGYGIHGVDITLILKGELGAVQFMIFTNRMLHDTHDRLMKKYLYEGKFKNLTPEQLNTIKNYHGPFTEGKEIEELVEYEKFINKIDPTESLEFFMVRPMAADLGYHSPKPMYDGHEAMGSIKYEGYKDVQVGKNKDGSPRMLKSPIAIKVPDAEIPGCEILDGKRCWYDGSGLAAKDVYEILINKGEEAVWKELEGYYKSTFENE